MKNAAELYKQAQEFIREKKFDDALQSLDLSLAIEETAEALHDKAIIHYLRSDADSAVTLLQSAVRIKPDYAQAYANLAKITLNRGDHIGALEYTGFAMKADPGNLAYADNFIQLMNGLDFKIFNPALKMLVLQCMETDNADHDKLSRPWYSLLQCDPGFRATHRLEKQKDYEDFRKAIIKHGIPEEMSSPYFLLGLRRLLVSEMAFEKMLTHLRRYLLEEMADDTLPLVAALAEYCFRTEYIFSVHEDEARALEILNEPLTPRQIAFVACYRPLYRLENADLLDAPEVDALITRQVREPFEEIEYRKAIAPLTAIEDKTSREVRAQYEEFPYPRWKAISHSYSVQIAFEQEIKTILIAGCGTGQEALQFAKAFPQASVLAIDMSLASLSYGMRKAAEYGIGNIEFRQADILRLGEIDRKFDLVSSSGVLHHLREPLAGWKVLLGLLKPRGYMQIALYSEAARRDIVAAREVIASSFTTSLVPGYRLALRERILTTGRYTNDLEGMRRFREDCPEILDRKTLEGLLTFRDFFSASECRDLLFHVMEHRFTLPQIEKILGELGLEFLAFTLPNSIRNRYLQEYPGDVELASLENMTAFEAEHPDTFKAMYVFWLRKK